MPDEVVITSTPSAAIRLDPKIEELLKPIIAKWQLAAARVASSFGEFEHGLPTDSGATPEEIVRERFDRLPGDVKIAARAKARRAGTNQATLTRIKRVLSMPDGGGRITIPAGVSVASVHAPKPNVITGAELQRIATKWFADLGLPPATGPLRFHQSHLDLKLVRIHCVDETDGFLGSEAGMDEIELGGQAVDPTKLDSTRPDFGVGAAMTTINAHRLPWKFNDGTEHDWIPPQVFHSFDLTALDRFPATYTVNMLMAEVDDGDFQDTLNAILNGVKDETITYLATSIGGVLGTGAGGPAGALIGAGVGFVVGKVFDYITGLFDDVVFDPVTLQVTIPSANAVISTPSAVTRFRGPGHYALRYDWEFHN